MNDEDQVIQQALAFLEFPLDERMQLRPGVRLAYSESDYSHPTTAEIRRALKASGLTGSKVAGLLGVNAQTIRRWVAGEQHMAYSAWRLLLILLGEVLPSVMNTEELLPVAPDSRNGLDSDFIESMQKIIVNLEKRRDDILAVAIEQGEPFADNDYARILNLHVAACCTLNRYKGEVAAWQHLIHTVPDTDLSIPERVTQFLRKTTKAYCDDCIAAELGLSRIQQVHAVTSALATTDDFHRFRGVCYSCRLEKLVTQEV
jgi:transcriptional regulator with XRE-family HTH domain